MARAAKRSYQGVPLACVVRRASSLAAWLLLIAWAACAAPQMPPPRTVAQVANRDPGLAAGSIDRADEPAAKAEGTVVWYTSTPLRQAQNVAEAFERRYGFKVELFRTGGEQVIQRFLTEASAGRTAVDLLTASDPAAFNAMVKRNQLVSFRPPNFEKVPDSAKNPEGYWVAQRLNLIGFAYRTDLLPAADLPKRWSDLSDPKYRGKLVHADVAFTSIALQVVGTHARSLGWDYYEALRRNDMMIVQGHQQLAQTLERGERVLAAEANNADIWDAARRGFKVDMIYPEDGVFVVPAPTGIVAGAPHPNAAKLLAEFMLSDEAQALFPEEGFYSARPDLPPPSGSPQLGTLKLISVDLDFVERETPQIKDRFGDIFS